MICVSLCFDPSATADGPIRPVVPLSTMAVRQLTQELDSACRGGRPADLDGPVLRNRAEYIVHLVAGLPHEALATLTTRTTGLRPREPRCTDPTTTHPMMKDSTCF